jgi:hypothetical protein
MTTFFFLKVKRILVNTMAQNIYILGKEIAEGKLGDNETRGKANETFITG